MQNTVDCAKFSFCEYCGNIIAMNKQTSIVVACSIVVLAALAVDIYARISNKPQSMPAVSLSRDISTSASKVTSSDSGQPIVMGIGDTVPIDFDTAKIIDAVHLSSVSPLVPTYAADGAKKVKGSEIDRDIKLSVLSTPGGYVTENILSIGRYLTSDSYDGVVSPWCDGSICNYRFGGLAPSQAEIVINLKFENSTAYETTFTPNAFRLKSGGQGYAQMQIDSVIVPPYSTVVKSMEALVPIDLNKFDLEYVGG